MKIQLHMTSDPVIQVLFPRTIKATKWWQIAHASYGTQAVVIADKKVCDDYGLESTWSVWLKELDVIVVTAPIRNPRDESFLGLGIGVVFPDLTLPVRFEKAGDYAIATIIMGMNEDIDLEKQAGNITLFLEPEEVCPGCGIRTSRRDPWAQIRHMERFHPEIGDQRRYEAGFRKRNDVWIDVLADPYS